MKKHSYKIFSAISLIAWLVFSLADSNRAGFFSGADGASFLVPLSITLMAWLAVVLSPLLALALPMMFAQFMLGGREYGFTITKNLLLESFALTFFYSILFYFYLAWLPKSYGCSCVGLLALMGVLFISLFGVLASLGEATAGDEFDESSGGLARFRARHAKLFAFCTKFFVCASVFLQAAFAVGAAVFFYGLKISHELNEMKWLAFFLPLAHVFFTSCLIVLTISRNIFDFSKALATAAFVFAAVFLSISSVSPLSAQMAMKKIGSGGAETVRWVLGGKDCRRWFKSLGGVLEEGPALTCPAE